MLKKNTCIFDEGAKYEENAGNHPLANTGHACEHRLNFQYVLFLLKIFHELFTKL
jgi:hypothetical protein